MEMAVNKELLLKTLETIKANPKHWDQQSWHCNTSHCFAGFAQLIDRQLPINRRSPLPNSSTREDAIIALRIDYYWADYLFAPKNDLEDLERIVNQIIEENKE
jgi:hypothetical protein